MSSQSPPDPSLSPHVQAILKDAPQLTRLFRQAEYRPEHLLATLLHRGQGTAIQILRDLGVDLVDLSLALEARIDAGETLPEGAVAPSADAEKIVKLSREAAQSLGHPQADTEHLLLALLQMDSIARSVLHQFKLEESAVRKKIAPAFVITSTEPSTPVEGREDSPPKERGWIRKDLDSAGNLESKKSLQEAGVGVTSPSPGMKKALFMAKAEAGRLGSDFIGPEHFLLGIIRAEEPLILRVFDRFGIDAKAIKSEIEESMKRAPIPPTGLFSMNPYATRVRWNASHIAFLWNHGGCGAEHLLLALASTEGTLPASALKRAGFDYEVAANMIRESVDYPPAFVSADKVPAQLDRRVPLTPGMREIQKLAKEMAEWLGHDCIGPEHYLLGILLKGDGLGFLVSSSLNAGLESLKDETEKQIGRGKGSRPGLLLPSEGAKRVLKCAREITIELGQSWIGTEHLVLALLKTEGTIPAQILKDAGVDYEKARRIVHAMKKGEFPDVPEGSPREKETKVRIQISHTLEARDIPLPSYTTEHAAGVDLRAAVPESEPMTIEPGLWAMVPTGLKIAIPVGFEGQVRPRSGLAAKHGIGLLNGPGTIDADYRGEIKVILFNFSKEPFVVRRGERIAQLVISRLTLLQWEPVKELPDTPRGEGGFGHTGR